MTRDGGSYAGPSGAESRHPRAGSGHGPRRYSYGSYGRSFYYPRHAYWGYGAFPYFDFYYGYPYGSPYGYGYGYYGGRYPGSYYRGDFGSVRVLVDPAETRVFVDGAYAGTADEFDGLFQRLRVTPGRHEIALKLEGYRTHRLRVYVPYDGTLKLHHDMVEGTGEDALEDLAGDRYGDDERYADREPPARPPRRRDDDGRIAGDREAESGTLRLDVSPEGASIYVDGEFRGTGRELGRLELEAGPHRVEILHPGLRTFEREIVLEPGESEQLEVELTR